MPITKRQTEIMKSCEAPKSITDLVNQFSVGYYTIRNELVTLQEMGLIQECPWRKGREKQYRTGFSISNGEKIESMLFAYGQNTYTATQILNSPTFQSQANVIGKAMDLMFVKPLWEFHVRNDEDQLATDGHPSKELVLEKLKTAAGLLDAMVKLLEQVINAPIWENNNVPALLIGSTEMDWKKVEEKLHELNAFAVERGW